MKLARLFLAIALFPATLLARTIIVDVNDPSKFTSIAAAISAAVNGDTVKVLPGVYDGAFTMSKSIVLMGSGYETTIISSNSNPTVTMNSGKMMWFAVTSNLGDGIWFSGGHLTNCVARGCARNGIWVRTNASGILSNSISYQNGNWGITVEGYTTVSVYNWISVSNSAGGYSGYCGTFCGGGLLVSYSCGGTNSTAGNVGNTNTDPRFTSSSDFHISPQSPGWDSGKPDVLDPDGSRSDMGYFGGPDCPIYPVVTEIRVTATTGGVQIRATGRANY